MATTALYHWTVPGAAVDVLLDLTLVDPMCAAASASATEIGGILFGHFDGKYTVITSFDPIESEHRRGAAYSLSKRDESRFAARLEARRRNRAEVPVGFFRSHLRPGLFLDEGDKSVVSSFFPNANQVVLAIRPDAGGTATGGFFFWEDGEMNRKQTYLPFPMSAEALEAGNFPLVEPVSSMPDASSIDSFAFENAETLDPSRPAAATLLSEPTLRRTLETPAPAHHSDRRRSWQLIALISAAAAFGGYLIGTSGSSHDRFGARAGDITLDPKSEPQPVPVAAAPKPLIAQTAPAASGSTAQNSLVPATSSADATAVSPANSPAGKPLAPATRVAPPPAPAPTVAAESRSVAPRTLSTRRPEAAAPRIAEPAAQTADNWQHFHPAQPTSASEVAAEAPAPNYEPVRATPHAAVAVSSVYLESVEAGGVSRAFSKIPLLGSFHHPKSGSEFTPPQALRSSAPNVPPDLARELTGTLPVDLRLKVDSNGKVSSVEILSHQTAAEFVRLAGDAAYNWQFQPARLKDKAVASDVIAHFKFRPAL